MLNFSALFLRWDRLIFSSASFLIAVLLLSATGASVFAASLGVAEPFEISNPTNQSITNGTIISFKEGTYQISPEAYDKNLFGVVSTDPALQITYQDISNTNPQAYPIQNTGLVDVRVTTANGPIKKGDRITSSATPGLGMKATQSGFSLGVAEQDFGTTSDTAQEGLIPVTLQIQFAFAEDTPESAKIAARLRDLVNLSSLAVLENPTTALQYLTAATVVIVSLGFSFLTFGRVAGSAVTALGRNPLAKHSILMGLVTNGFLALAVLSIGAGVAYFMITF